MQGKYLGACFDVSDGFRKKFTTICFESSTRKLAREPIRAIPRPRTGPVVVLEDIVKMVSQLSTTTPVLENNNMPLANVLAQGWVDVVIGIHVVGKDRECRTKSMVRGKRVVIISIAG